MTPAKRRSMTVYKTEPPKPAAATQALQERIDPLEAFSAFVAEMDALFGPCKLTIKSLDVEPGGKAAPWRPC